ncbi:type II 3-dehydroquinate dehydratase [bacterium]|nr:type II 3-dehydroquinate dehydratase [bacterium]|tara:strand:+ start:333 stop:764 length:432 start_codon:yes stop_codon:yes gene_type:complete
MKQILIIHGPNLNQLGTREPDIYGAKTLTEINEDLSNHAKSLNLQLTFFQSNIEGELVDCIQGTNCDGIIINPAAYTHTSIAIRDAIAGKQLPVIEVHLSNVYQRESFRHHSHVAPVCIGQITGFGATSYLLALSGMADHLNR